MVERIIGEAREDGRQRKKGERRQDKYWRVLRRRDNILPLVERVGRATM
jgi:hypothetical protein